MISKSEVLSQLQAVSSSETPQQIIDLHVAYTETGVSETVAEILAPIDEEMLRPIIDTLQAFPTKDKPMLLYDLGKAWSIEPGKIQRVAAVTDILWALSLMVDDIEDNDDMRGGRETAWVRYGREHTMASAQTGLETVLRSTGVHLGPHAAGGFKSAVENGMLSLALHKRMGLTTSVQDLVGNYDMRAAFHTDAPVSVLAGLTEQGKPKHAVQGMYEIARAGQILNDLKDFFPGFQEFRKGFTDLRSGAASIPIVLLYSRAPEDCRALMEQIFGSGSITDKESHTLRRAFVQTCGLEDTMQLAEQLYRSGSTQLGIATDHQQLPHTAIWLEFKQNQIRSMIEGISSSYSQLFSNS